ncbi:MAG TPA: sialate O-acetylesterase [Pontiellaceae bacterium]|nr:sialate O-acetylesterase [Pontiellaceae bacterium]HPR82605.1 sialate O-acetylesterase [Pontiellaceae bacterium]
MKNGQRITVFMLTLLLSCGLSAQDNSSPQDWQIPAQKENFHIFLLMGQSNMAGFGEMLPEDTQPVPRVLKLPTIGEVQWEPAAHPLHNRQKSDRFGLGLPFAEEYLKDKPGVVVGLIPVAQGGAAIDKMNKGTPIYADAIKKAEFAATQGVIKGVLWHQGESDTTSAPRTDIYEQKLHQLIADLRQDLKDDNLPFIAGNLAEFYGTGPEHNKPDRVARIDMVRATLRALPDKVKNTGFAESTGCSSADAHMVHFDRNSYIILGKRYAEVYSRIINKELKTPGQLAP